MLACSSRQGMAQHSNNSLWLMLMISFNLRTSDNCTIVLCADPGSFAFQEAAARLCHI